MTTRRSVVGLFAAVNFAVGLFAVGLGLATAAPGQEPPVEGSSASPEAAGWRPLFDGGSTSAWRGYRRPDFPEQGWRVRDAAVVHEARGGGGDLVTQRTWRDFELVFDWRVAPGANSGLLYRVVETEHPSYWTGIEYQVIDDAAHPDADPRHLAAAIYGLYPARTAEPTPAGAWRAGRIVVRDGHLEHWLDGELVAAADVGSEDWAQRVAASKFAAWTGFARSPRGYLALQDHGDEVAFRAIRIRELDPPVSRHEDPVALFDGSEDSLWAWSIRLDDPERTMSDLFLVEDERLVCRGWPLGTLYTKERWSDFVLRVVWRRDPQVGVGDGRIFVRASVTGSAVPRAIAVELGGNRVGDLRSFGGAPLRGEPTRRRGRTLRRTHDVEAPGEWNHSEIICDADTIRIVTNGEVVNDAFGLDVGAAAIGFDAAGGRFEFREITLIPLRP